MQQERKRLAGGLETERRWEDGISKEGERRGRRSRADGQREGEAACKEGREATAETKARIRMNDSFRLSLERAFIRTPESLFGSDARERNTGIAKERERRTWVASEREEEREREGSRGNDSKPPFYYSGAHRLLPATVKEEAGVRKKHSLTLAIMIIISYTNSTALSPTVSLLSFSFPSFLSLVMF